MKYNAVLFDMDGTVLDTLEDLTAAVNHSLSRFNLPEVSHRTVRAALGNGAAHLISRCIPAGTDEALKAELAERFHRDIEPGRIAMLGDSLASDIRGAKANGLFAGLVLSGITTPELAASAPADRVPDLIFSGV